MLFAPIVTAVVVSAYATILKASGLQWVLADPLLRWQTTPYCPPYVLHHMEEVIIDTCGFYLCDNVVLCCPAGPSIIPTLPSEKCEDADKTI